MSEILNSTAFGCTFTKQKKGYFTPERLQAFTGSFTNKSQLEADI